MFTNPHNQNLLNDVMRVLGGETTEKPIKPVPQWISEAASTTAVAIKGLVKEGHIMTLETQRDIMRKHLSEAIDGCNCTVNSETSVQFEEEVRKSLEEKAAPLATPAKVEAQTKNPAKIDEEVSVVESELREFLTQLTEEEVTVLRNIINENR
jgi:hypothetical protein